MTFQLTRVIVGPWPMNAYMIIHPETGTSAIVDPGADPGTLLKQARDTRVAAILVTHGHPDHVGALEEVMAAVKAPLYVNPLEAQAFNLPLDIPLKDGDRVSIGDLELRAIHTPGHTTGMTCLDLGDGRILVGDTIFVGGPGKTWSPAEFTTTMRTMQEIVFTWPDKTRFFPGHGPSGTIGEERPAFEGFVARGWPPDLHGDVTWE